MCIDQAPEKSKTKPENKAPKHSALESSDSSELKALKLITSKIQGKYIRTKRLIQFLNKQRMTNNQQTKLSFKKPDSQEQQKVEYILVSEDNLEETCKKIQESRTIAIDTETSGLDSKTDQILLVQHNYTYFFFEMTSWGGGEMRKYENSEKNM